MAAINAIASKAKHGGCDGRGKLGRDHRRYLGLWSTIKICLAEHYKFVMIGQTCRLITAEVKPPRLMKWIGRSSLWSGLRLPF